MVNVPCTGERVYYFPQGHLEQLQASTNQESNKQIPRFNLPSKILCHVFHIQLRAEPETDEVYTQITLHPEPDQTEPTSPDPCPPDPPKQNVRSFCKILTASDRSTHGGLSILRRDANECLPPLDMTQATPSQDLVAKDLHGYEWRFRHIFRGQPRRHLLTTGWSTFVASKRLVAGDAFVFLSGDNGELRVGVRRLARQQSPIPPSIISSESMHLGVLASASHAITTKTLFVVYYKPRASQFIIGMNKYLEAVRHKFTVGMHFKMRFKEVESREKRSTGTIIGVGDISPHWKDSNWRSLKIQWDEPGTERWSQRVSPWEIEPFVASASIDIAQPATKNKIPRLLDRHPSGTTNTTTSSWGMWAPTSVRNDSPNLFRESEYSKNASVLSILSDYNSPVSSRTDKDHFLDQVDKSKKVETTSACRLFGIDLRNNANNISRVEKEVTVPNITSKCANGVDTMNNRDVLKFSEERKHVFEVLPNDTQRKQISITSTRTRTKVQMEGISVGRAVNLSALEGYDDLITELEKMFEIKGGLRPINKWVIIYTDNEGDVMLVGDDPWPKFCKRVKKICIYSREEVKKMNPRCLSSTACAGEGTARSLDSEPKLAE
ncbi:auxin response factor 9-like isoform X2 [Olea europaea var. sylvestris]|nr:auxin response factor 9-like isoform X2 [Olea europaea var. sylvestris]CAA2965338.1 auxin response factor 9-like isoform X2 [Olea europaea subsp. europaea]